MKENETTGALAAIAAPFFMALGFIIWDVTWKKSKGSAFALNLYKCNLASIGFVIIGSIFGFTKKTTDDDESEAMLESVGYLILSGFIGIIIGDLAWLEALRQLGASKVLVIDTVKPFAAAFFGWLILEESIHKVAFAGIALTVLGVLIVSLESESKDNEKEDEKEQLRPTSGLDEEEAQASCAEEDQLEPSSTAINEEIIQEELPREEVNLSTEKDERTSRWNTRRGYALAIGNVFLDTYGSLLTKQHGMKFSTWAINLIRFGSSGVIMIVVSCLMHLYNRKRPRASQSDVASVTPWYQLPQMNAKSWVKISIGVLFVTFFCPALSNYALFQIALALVLTLGSISPLYALLLEWPIHGATKKPTLRAIGGASLAIGGVVILGIFNTQDTR